MAVDLILIVHFFNSTIMTNTVQITSSAQSPQTTTITNTTNNAITKIKNKETKKKDTTTNKTKTKN